MSSATLDVEEFILPMSGRVVGVLVVLALATVFGLGMLLGGNAQVDEEGLDTAGSSPAAGSDGASASLSFAPPGPRHSRQSGAGIGTPVPASGVISGVQRAKEASAPVREAAAPANEAPVAEELTAAERAFFDPAMKFTIMAITYTRTEANIGLAWEAYDFLVAKGFPAVRPFPSDGRIFIFVGAEEASAALTDTLHEVRSLKVPPSNRTDFRSAYPVNIASYR